MMYFKECNITDPVSLMGAAPVIVYMEDREVLDRSGQSVLVAKNVSQEGKACYFAVKSTGQLPVKPGSEHTVGINPVNPTTAGGVADMATVMRVKWFDVVAPTSMMRIEENGDTGYIVFFTWPGGSKSDVILGPLGGKFVPINRSAKTGRIGKYNVGNFSLADDARPRRSKPLAWTMRDPEFLMACAGPGPAVMPASQLEHIKALLVLEKKDSMKVDDGSLMKIRDDGRLWSSSTNNPATYVWVPVLRKPGGKCRGDDDEDWVLEIVA